MQLPTGILLIRLARSMRSGSRRIAAVAQGCACALALSWQVKADCPPPSSVPPSVPLSELRAGQYNVGIDNVLQIAQRPLRQRWTNAGGGAAGASAVDAYLKDRPVPVILGPSAQLHLVDNHHRTTAIHTLHVELGDPFPNYVYYYVIADFSALSGAAFWSRLIEGGPVLDEECNPVGDRQHQYLWPYDRGVLQDPNVTPPPMIPALRDDVLRSISANARFANGYMDFEDDDTPAPPFVVFFQEFYWANFLRDRVFLQGAGWELRGGNVRAQLVFDVEPGETVAQATRRVVATAALLCRGANASALPGWTCAADVFADGVVDGEDLAAVLGGWGSLATARYDIPTSDINQDGAVDGTDLSLVLAAWGACEAP